MSSTKEFFQEFNAEKGGHVRLADDEKTVEVHGIGSGTVKCVVDSNQVSEMKLHDVLLIDTTSNEVILPVTINSGDDGRESLESGESEEESSEEHTSEESFEADVFEAPTTEERIQCRRSERPNRGVPPDRFGLEDAKGSSIPLDLGYVKNREGSPPMPKNEKYQQLIGALLYLAVNTRPDISASVAILSQHNQEPTTADWTEAKRVVRYLKSTIHYELRLGQRDAKKGLIGFADADWAQNRFDRKSNSGYLFKYYGAPISWSCRKQACVALSSTEAEYVALAEASQEGLWIRRLLEDFTGKVQERTPIYEDNQSCLKLICNNKFNHRTKHIDTKYHFVKELQVQGIMDYQYCPTEQMTADMLTKPLGRIKLRSIAEGCGLTTQ
ncbi:Copia protein [Anthophora quadrimaculata]